MLVAVPSSRATLICAILLCSAAASAQSDPRAKALCAQVPGIADELTKISGMKLRHAVPCDFISKEEINQFLKKRIKDTSTPDEVRAEELTLKKFGLIPQNFDLAKNEVDLLTEQAAAFYDYDRKKLFITDSTSSDSQTPVLAHELSHALADQNYNLARFIKQGRKSDDGSTARLAVMEGQATWMMSEYLARQAGTSLKDSATLAATMANMAAGDEGDVIGPDEMDHGARLEIVVGGVRLPHAAGARESDQAGDRLPDHLRVRPPKHVLALPDLEQ